MLDISVSESTSASPEQVLAAATDLSEDRVKVWPNSKPQHFEVHAQGAGFAEVTEGVPAALWPRLGAEPLRVGACGHPPGRDRLQRASARQYLGAQGFAEQPGQHR